VLILNFLTLPSIAGAQTHTATLSGTVTDSQSAIMVFNRANFSHPNVAFNSRTFGQSVKLRMFLQQSTARRRAALESFNLA
jgi:hypothetical protein